MNYFIHPAEARRQFVELLQGEFGYDQLARAALLISLEDQPGIEVEHYIRALDGLADRAIRRASPSDPSVFRLGHLHAEMFDVDGYRGDQEDYYDTRNAYLNEVMDRKLGLPISLSVIFLHAATRMGLAAAGVGLPGHYIVKVQFELNEVYVDPFNGGATLTMSEIAELISGMSGGRARLTGEHLRAWSARETLARMLANLHGMWTRAGDPRKAASALERMELLQAGLPT
jgi:regulator of sirC expression with transglutaminase-like and TPR domain